MAKKKTQGQVERKTLFGVVHARPKQLAARVSAEQLRRDLVEVFGAGVRAAKESGASAADTIAAFSVALRKIY